MKRTLFLAACMALAAAAPSPAQTSQARQRALPIYREGWVLMRSESWAEAAKAFQQAIDLDQEFEDAYYSLGRANMGLKQFEAAIAAYRRCEALYREAAAKQFSSSQDAQRYRQDRITEIDESIRQLQSGPQNQTSQERLRQLQEQRRQIQQSVSRGTNVSVSSTVPAFVPLALGSAYFRAQRLDEAEKSYKLATQIDPKAGEAWNNLAVVYLETNRVDEAENAVKAAERAGFKVHPGLKDDIKKKKEKEAPAPDPSAFG
jgi:tetratricopeptide (TPR) repeat protein